MDRAQVELALDGAEGVLDLGEHPVGATASRKLQNRIKSQNNTQHSSANYPSSQIITHNFEVIETADSIPGF